MTKKARIGRAGLFLAALLWGMSFIVMKTMLDNIPVLFLLSIRFIGAALALFPVCIKNLKRIDINCLVSALIMGVFILAGYVLQTYGLERTTPGKNAFLTAVYCVIVPFLNWVYIKKRPDRYNIIAACMCIVGTGFITLDSTLTIGLGDALSMICGVFFALHIVATSKFVQKHDPVVLTMLQFAVAGIITLIAALILEKSPQSLSAGAIFDLLYLIIVATAICIFLQVFGQKHTPPAQAAVIMTFEAVFGAVASVIMLYEQLSLRLVAGFCFTFVSVLISETKLSFLRKKRSIKS